jgi:rhodanese-related sulfurtransferase
MKFLNLFLFLFAISACSNGQEETLSNNQTVLRVSNAAFDSIIKSEPDIQLIDVRTANEFDAGKIKGAQNYDILNGDFERVISELEKDKPVALYCHGGNRSSRAREMLENNGFSYIIELEKGYSNYKK